jgi:hypothetical protein
MPPCRGMADLIQVADLPQMTQRLAMRRGAVVGGKGY